MADVGPMGGPGPGPGSGPGTEQNFEVYPSHPTLTPRALHQQTRAAVMDAHRVASTPGKSTGWVMGPGC